MGTLKKAEIEAVPNVSFILFQIALLSRREPWGDFFSKNLDFVEICHEGTLEKAEIEAVPNIEFILIQIALLSRRKPSGDFRKF